eukprot:1211207-Rhodomonas_salina.1
MGLMHWEIRANNAVRFNSKLNWLKKGVLCCGIGCGASMSIFNSCKSSGISQVMSAPWYPSVLISDELRISVILVTPGCSGSSSPKRRPVKPAMSRNRAPRVAARPGTMAVYA